MARRTKLGDWLPLLGGGAKTSPQSIAAEIRPGFSRTMVHDRLQRQPASLPDTNSEVYRFQTEGKFFFVGPNPEGGMIGVNHRHVEYRLRVQYEGSAVRSCELAKTADIYDSHESYWSWPP